MSISSCIIFEIRLRFISTCMQTLLYEYLFDWHLLFFEFELQKFLVIW